jgi:leucyl-tRNA synthetase
MTLEYSFKDIESKWQEKWEISGLHTPNLTDTEKKFYNLTMFSYPSGDKLHIGHWYNYGPADTYARFMKMRGYNVFQPQGFDAFGLPAENYAIKHGVHPSESTQTNINTMRKQLKSIGAMYDWSNEVNTSSVAYYRWTQWLFLKLYEMGLAYQKTAPVNWCPSCSTVLANEQVKEGVCDRCKDVVTKKHLTQWFFKITDYAEELLQCLDNLDWPEKTKQMQRNWIGKSTGANIFFKEAESGSEIEVFTTRPDTIYGATYMVLAPEHPLLSQIVSDDQQQEVEAYIESSKKKSEIERTSLDREKTGVFTGAFAINPINNGNIPIWVADYVVISYGTGAIMAVPSGDERDFEFAEKYNLPIIEVVSKDGKEYGNDHCFSGYGIAINSGQFSGKKTEEVQQLIINQLVERKCGGKKIQYKLHDWLISRQRYWGTPIPVVHCKACGTVPVPADDLPVLLPEDMELSTTYGDELSPLATSETFLHTSCPACNGSVTRDADTMDTFVCSSWYYLRYPNAEYEKGPFDPNGLDWLPVDCYIGGSEHATMHLLYARFITKALRDGGYLNFDEPFTKLYHQGTITKDGAKMSKSRGNTVSPDEFIERYGSDTFRAYLMFMGPFDEGGDWNDKGITGIDRFLKKVWKFCNLPDSQKDPEKTDLQVVHKTIQSVRNNLEEMKFNTSISRLMEFINHFNKNEEIHRDIKQIFIKLLAPVTPHIAEELWQINGNDASVFLENYPDYDPTLCIDDHITIAIQVNGKLRGSVEVAKDIEKENLLSEARSNENVHSHIEGKQIIKEIVVPQRLVNFVVK